MKHTFLHRALTAATVLGFAVTPAVADSIYKPVAPDTESKGKILMISNDDFNDTEVLYPLYRFIEEGYEVTVASIDGGDIEGYNSAVIPETHKIVDLNPSPGDYAGLYLPGGKAPSKLREDGDVLAVVKAFAEAGKPIAAICHGPQILVSAGLAKGKSMTSVKDVESEITEADGTYVDEPVVKDGQFLTSRLPGDLPVQMRSFLEMIKGQP